MAYYVYILKSEIDNTFYKGFSEKPLDSLLQHNNGESKYTAAKKPWLLVGLLIFETKKEALIVERKMKKYGHDKLNSFLNSNRNQLADWMKLQ